MIRSAFEGLVSQNLLEWPDSATNWRKTLTDGLDKGEFLDVAQTENGLVVGYVMGCHRHDDPIYGVKC